MIRPLDISNMDIPLKGFDFIEEIENNKNLRAKIIEDSVLPPATAEEYVENMLFHHSLKKQALENKEKIPAINKILNIVSSHKIRETLKDIGYDGIIYEGKELQPVDEQMERIQKFAGGILSRAARKELLRRKKE